MPPAYVIGEVDIHDDETYAQYRAQVPATLAARDGEFIVRGGRRETLEGTPWRTRIVVLRFPSYEQAKAWYDSAEYAGPKALRQSVSDGRLVLVEGV